MNWFAKPLRYGNYLVFKQHHGKLLCGGRFGLRSQNDINLNHIFLNGAREIMPKTGRACLGWLQQRNQTISAIPAIDPAQVQSHIRELYGLFPNCTVAQEMPEKGKAI